MRKTTLMIPESVFRKLKQQAAERGETMSSLVTEFLRRGLAETPRAGREDVPELPTFDLGAPLIDFSDREELYAVLEADRDARLYGLGEEGA